jgi:hypothetical protein
MTAQQIEQMIHDAEKERRRARFEQGNTSAQYGHRLPSKRHPTRMTVKQSLRREQW